MSRPKQILLTLSFEVGALLGVLIGISLCPRSVPPSACWSIALFIFMLAQLIFFSRRRRPVSQVSAPDTPIAPAPPRRTSVLYVLVVESGLLACICLASWAGPRLFPASSFWSVVAFFLVFAHIMLFSPRRTWGFRESSQPVRDTPKEAR